MNGKTRSLSLALSAPHRCSYLPGQQERLQVITEPGPLAADLQAQLQASGFRRSGDIYYRPHCPTCQACQALRVPVQRFVPSRSQRRLLGKCRDLRWTVAEQPTAEHYALFARYIEQRHRDGSMYPPEPAQFHSLLGDDRPLLLELRDGNSLLLCAVTDQLADSLSAVYTFYEPQRQAMSPGTLGVLGQLALGQRLGKQWLYLGYQIDACPKMNYKVRFRPYQRLVDQRWVEFAA